jgi:hypothetical protein
VRSKGGEVNGFVLEVLAKHLQIVAEDKLVHVGEITAARRHAVISPAA